MLPLLRVKTQFTRLTRLMPTQLGKELVIFVQRLK